MRELKFRAWVKSEKCYMGKWIDTQYLTTFSAVNEVAEYYGDDDLVIEQYTGLKDKNGKEIYEGDIIRICRSYGYGFLPKGAVAVVSYDENECCYKLKKQGEFRLTSKKMVEVIGNIHENPELIEEEE